MPRPALVLTARDRMIALDYQKLADTPAQAEPFPHIVVPSFVPPDDLRAVLADLPPLNRRGSFPSDSGALGPAAHELVGEMEGDGLRDLIAD